MSLVQIPISNFFLEAELVMLQGSTGLVIFAHGSGSSRHSPRNNYVAEQLQDRGLSTLLVDLLTEQEDKNYQARFNICLLTERLKIISGWVTTNKITKQHKLGYFGASTGAAAAMFAAGKDTPIKAFVSRGGRVDLAISVASGFSAPTLLIVGGEDREVIKMNQQVFAELKCEKDIKIIPGATHLFEEPGTLEQVADLAADWFTKHL